eukprot:CAMPEP_0115390706 /NCGR_PEP_ID=MMETSP0271-20121206/10338_1 /TAXON_ID=71861 /ORGANISM="Scrippsiella trochoidea, Strain CCMP3099" /LENGTH=827 /DNA_ID=CAMNT_0002814253 /DNA_START=55 /DNA_END=2538 /DNA_ORIENTATION=-
MSSSAAAVSEQALGNAGESPQPFGPTPGQAPASASAAKPKEDIAKAVSENLTSKSSGPPSAPAAQAAAAQESPAEAAQAAAAKAMVKPSSVAAKAAAGDPAAAMKGAEEPKKPAAAISKAPAGRPVAPTSAAAIIPETGPMIITATDRQAALGSVLASGAGAQAEAAGPKAKAKAKGTGTPARPASGYLGKASAVGAAARAAPASVLDIVTGTPQPVLESSKNLMNRRGSQIGLGAGPVGPAKAYAKSAASALASADLPKYGPAAVAVGRAIEAGLADSIQVKGKPRVPIGKKYQVAFVASEVAPFSKTGGLGEAMDGLPVALAALGHRVMVIAPRYDQYSEAWDTSFWSSVTMAGKQESVHFFHTYKQKVDYVFVDHPTFLERVNGLSGAKLYGPEWGKDFADNQARFAYFCKAALVAIKDLPLGGFPYGHQTMVVANDWHSALVPMFIHAQREANPELWRDTKSALLCHNAVFQGRFEYEEGLAHVFDVPQAYVDSITFKMPLKVGKYNKKVKCVNTMSAGLRYADRVLTVSPSYARECATDPEKGVELEELFALGRVTGILNGVKEGVSPSDKNFTSKTKMTCGTYTEETASLAKEQLKMAYRAESGLPESPGPLMCFIGRLDAQKGYDLLLEALTEVLQDTELQVVIVGAGRADLVEETRALEKKFPSKFFYAGWMGPERYALLAGCDYTLLPSRWEPCGLVQMEAMRMGTLPIVAPTGGLRDTVEDGINGIWTDAEMTVEAEVDEESCAAIARAVRRAAAIHAGSPEKEAQMKRAAMAAASEYTWSNAALQYEAVFEELGVREVLSMSADKTVTLEVDKQVC